jgi:hypothetical protein
MTDAHEPLGNLPEDLMIWMRIVPKPARQKRPSILLKGR